MSVGNLRDQGNQSKNFPWQLKMLLGQQCACDQLTEILTELQGTIDVNIVGGVTLDVNLDQNNDQVQVYGSDLTAPIATDASGHLQVDILTIPEVEIKNDAGNPVIVDTNSTTRTPALIRATGAGSIAAGARSISVFNAGNAAGSILGVAANILPGEVFEFSAGGENDVLSVFAYDGTGTTLVITSIV
jgi:hypothetical protein